MRLGYRIQSSPRELYCDGLLAFVTSNSSSTKTVPSNFRFGRETVESTKPTAACSLLSPASAKATLAFSVSMWYRIAERDEQPWWTLDYHPGLPRNPAQSENGTIWLRLLL